MAFTETGRITFSVHRDRACHFQEHRNTTASERSATTGRPIHRHHGKSSPKTLPTSLNLHRDGARHFQLPQRPSVSLSRAPKHNSKRKISNNRSPHPSPPRQSLSQDTARLLKSPQRFPLPTLNPHEDAARPFSRLQKLSRHTRGST